MGSAYWQVNDSNPVISWSSIDYFGRWKGLHYYAKRFYAPCLISCDDTNRKKPVSAKTDRLFLMLRTFSGSYFFLGRDLRSSSQAVISTNVVARRAANASSRYCISLTARMA